MKSVSDAFEDAEIAREEAMRLVGMEMAEAIPDSAMSDEKFDALQVAIVGHLIEIARQSPASTTAADAWVPAKWHDLTSDDDNPDGQYEPIGDTIRLTWENGTALVGRLTVGSVGSGHQQVCRMQTIFGGDTYVFPHGSTLEKYRVAAPEGDGGNE